MHARIDRLLLPLTTLLLAAGALGTGLGADAGRWAWVVGAGLGLAASTASVIEALRAGRLGVDLVAVLALAGTLLIGEPFAGAVLAVMVASGRTLEARASARAKRDLGLLVERAPRTARRVEGAQGVVERPVEEVRRGDRLLVGTGELVPVDARLCGPAVLDESSLTGEPLPVEHHEGESIRSGAVNRGSPFECLATALAAESTYAGLVRLVAEARADSAPDVRHADRMAAVFVPFTIGVAALAWWAGGGPARAVAVLVVATPCPLLIAVPIAVMSGLSRVSRLGVVVKGGAALEALARGRVLLFDKTGTLTTGRPQVADVISASDDASWLSLAGSLEQVSPHVVAGAVVWAARQAGGALAMPSEVIEQAGRGLEGLVQGRRVRVGGGPFVLGPEWPAWARQARRRAALDGQLAVFVAVDDEPRGALLLDDPIRPDAPRMLRALKRAGIERTVLVTGDRSDVAESVGRIVGVDDVRAEQDPAAKVAVVAAESRAGPTIMVGDGVNDAPALARADVGVALAARGASASSEAADVVLVRDRIDGLADAILVARRSQRIARESAWLGMGLSGALMFAALLGHLTAPAGAVLQEAVDLIAIASALRALRRGRMHTVTMDPSEAALARSFARQHEGTGRAVERLRTVADGLDVSRFDVAPVEALLVSLEEVLVPHEHAEEAELYPKMERLMGGPESVAPLSRTHAEIDRQLALLRRLVGDLSKSEVRPEDVVELRRLLYGLYAVLRLHNAQEEESVYSLVGEEDVERRPGAGPS